MRKRSGSREGGAAVNYLSVCSGIEAATVAWRPLGWRAVGFSEIDAFPSAVLAHHYPKVPNLGDMTKFKEWPDATADVLVGGTPCQSFSVAGLRRGLADPRGNLMLVYLAIAERYRPRWLVWENVPGVLSSNEGRDFGALLGGLAELGYGFAYRVLDAQYFGLAQRRKRVFVVGCLGDWRRAASVLFEPASLRGDLAPRREAGKGIANALVDRPDRGGGNSDGQRLIAHALRGDGFDASEDGTGRGVPLVPEICGTLSDGAHMGGGLNGQDAYTGRIIPYAFDARQSNVIQYSNMTGPLDTHGHTVGVAFAIQAGALRENPASGPNGAGVQKDCAYTIEARAEVQAVAFDTTQITSAANYSNPKPGDPCHPLAAGAHPPALASTSAVRRLTPRECERLQGFPDDYTLIPVRSKLAADGPRYKALGNSMAVPVMAWIGGRIDAISRIRSAA